MAELGIFVVPGGQDPAATVAQGVAADRAGLDYVAVQDHPYQRRFLDTWTYLSYLAGVVGAEAPAVTAAKVSAASAVRKASIGGALSTIGKS